MMHLLSSTARKYSRVASGMAAFRCANNVSRSSFLSTSLLCFPLYWLHFLDQVQILTKMTFSCPRPRVYQPSNLEKRNPSFLVFIALAQAHPEPNRLGGGEGEVPKRKSRCYYERKKSGGDGCWAEGEAIHYNHHETGLLCYHYKSGCSRIFINLGKNSWSLAKWKKKNVGWKH